MYCDSSAWLNSRPGDGSPLWWHWLWFPAFQKQIRLPVRPKQPANATYLEQEACGRKQNQALHRFSSLKLRQITIPAEKDRSFVFWEVFGGCYWGNSDWLRSESKMAAEWTLRTRQPDKHNLRVKAGPWGCVNEFIYFDNLSLSL